MKYTKLVKHLSENNSKSKVFNLFKKVNWREGAYGDQTKNTSAYWFIQDYLIYPVLV
jgi:hypothetical protein